MSDRKGAPASLTVIARMRARAGAEPALRDALDALVTATRAEQGCVTYDLYQSQDDQSRFVMFEVWASRAHHDTHGDTPHLRAFVAASADLLDGGIDVDRLAPAQPGEDS